MYKKGARGVYWGALEPRKLMQKVAFVRTLKEKVMEKLDTKQKDMEKKEFDQTETVTYVDFGARKLGR